MSRPHSSDTVAVLQALDTSGTREDVLKRLHERGHKLTDEQLQGVLDAQVAEYRLLRSASGVYLRLPAGERAIADAALVHGGAQ